VVRRFFNGSAVALLLLLDRAAAHAVIVGGHRAQLLRPRAHVACLDDFGGEFRRGRASRRRCSRAWFYDLGAGNGRRHKMPVGGAPGFVVAEAVLHDVAALAAHSLVARRHLHPLAAAVKCAKQFFPVDQLNRRTLGKGSIGGSAGAEPASAQLKSQQGLIFDLATPIMSSNSEPGMNTDMYKRGQAVLVLWQAFAGPFHVADPVVSSTFARRVSKFIELGVGTGERPGAGTDIGFDLAAVFEIGIALDLQDIGLNQLEVARFAMIYRRQLREALTTIDLTSPQGPPVLMLLRARAATEPVRSTETLPIGFSQKQMSWYEPEFVEGIEGLGKRLEKLGGRDRKRLVIEIRGLALSLAHDLPRMPAKRRGRP